MAGAAWRLVDFLNPQELTNTAWAFATASHPDPDLFEVLARAAEKNIGDFNTQGLSNTAWAFAKVGMGAGRPHAHVWTSPAPPGSTCGPIFRLHAWTYV